MDRVLTSRWSASFYSGISANLLSCCEQHTSSSRSRLSRSSCACSLASRSAATGSTVLVVASCFFRFETSSVCERNTSRKERMMVCSSAASAAPHISIVLKDEKKNFDAPLLLRTASGSVESPFRTVSVVSVGLSVPMRVVEMTTHSGLTSKTRQTPNQAKPPRRSPPVVPQLPQAVGEVQWIQE